MKVKRESEVAQSYLTLCNPMDCSLPGSSIHGIFQARVLEWGAISFSNSSLSRDWTQAPALGAQSLCHWTVREVPHLPFVESLTSCMHAKTPQSCLTLVNTMDCSPQISSVQGFSKQEYWSGLPFPSPRDLPNPEIEPTSLTSPAFQVDSLPLVPPGKPFYLLRNNFSPWVFFSYLINS